MQIKVKFEDRAESFEVEQETTIAELRDKVKIEYDIQKSVYLKLPGAKNGLKCKSTVKENGIEENGIVHTCFWKSAEDRAQKRLNGNFTKTSYKHAITKKMDDNKGAIIQKIDDNTEEVMTKIEELMVHKEGAYTEDEMARIKHMTEAQLVIEKNKQLGCAREATGRANIVKALLSQVQSKRKAENSESMLKKRQRLEHVAVSKLREMVDCLPEDIQVDYEPAMQHVEKFVKPAKESTISELEKRPTRGKQSKNSRRHKRKNNATDADLEAELFGELPGYNRR